MNKDMFRVITGKSDDVETVLNTTEANWSHTTPETHGLNQSSNSLSFEDIETKDSSFLIAAVIVPLLLCLLCAVLEMGYRFREKLKGCRNCNPDEHGANKDAQANTSALPLMTLNNGKNLGS